MTDDTEDPDIAAFPNAVPANWEMMQTGMSLRDWFAGQALMGIFATRYPGNYAEHAREAYRYAQAMLVERQKYEGDA